MKWDLFWLGLARYTSAASKDPSTKVGAVVVNDKRQVISLGYNGFPRKVADTPERLNNRDEKYKLVVHAEANAIVNATGPLDGCTLYVWPFMPCSGCAGLIAQAGIKRVVSLPDDNPRWAASFEVTRSLFAEVGIELVLLPHPIGAAGLVLSSFMDDLRPDS
ncbi:MULTISPECIES: dCMP deaminase family protein [unclassified Beijerinckia]|uniref:dCMP deaminase family protein n=1 Tax=unclassified Beijerinckia TaxID=2638183 RepID=UPI000896A5F8|nr:MULTISPECIES: dCMP deaminase family protein [unclassified Beijerinckia]MDH7796465.1 dCMP deaminase [Beijerinckia sp. GAS462]SEC46237.1 dCMP deaminase [Beijerinckia sp. 28-YEA-48]